MVSKVVSITCYAISALFVYTICFLAFINEPPATKKFAMMGAFLIPASIFLGIGLAVARFINWRRDVGIVFTSAASFLIFVVFSMACMFMSPEFRESFPIYNIDFFSDYVSGSLCTLFFSLAGVLLIMNSKT